jgi:hypothetical protein
MSLVKIKSNFKQDEIFTEIMPDLPPWLDGDAREELMGEIGEYILSEIFDYVGEGKSPVTGEAFKKLSEKYAEKEKFGDRNPNLDLRGDMLRAIELQVESDKIRIGIFNEEEAVKAYGHNTGFKGHPFLEGKAPKRQFIPNKNDLFADDIMAGIDEMIEEYVADLKTKIDEEEDLG